MIIFLKKWCGLLGWGLTFFKEFAYNKGEEIEFWRAYARSGGFEGARSDTKVGEE